eukprot:tig00000042_g15486.t1
MESVSAELRTSGSPSIDEKLNEAMRLAPERHGSSQSETDTEGYGPPSPARRDRERGRRWSRFLPGSRRASRDLEGGRRPSRSEIAGGNGPSGLAQRASEALEVELQLRAGALTEAGPRPPSAADRDQERAQRPSSFQSEESDWSVHSTAGRRSAAIRTGLAELSAFGSLLRLVRSRFLQFQKLSETEMALLKTVLSERKTKLEMEVRADETRKFLQTMSHEMRTPLNGVLGMLHLARECELPPEAAEYVEMVRARPDRDPHAALNTSNIAA